MRTSNAKGSGCGAGDMGEFLIDLYVQAHMDNPVNPLVCLSIISYSLCPMKMKTIGLLALLAPLSSFAGIVSSTTTDNSVIGDELATTLRGLGAAFWDQDDSIAYEGFPSGTYLFSTTAPAGPDLDWHKFDHPLQFSGPSVSLWGIFSEAGDTNLLLAQGSSDAVATPVVANKDAAFLTDTFVFTPDTAGDDIHLSLEDVTFGTGPFNFLPNVVFATTQYEGYNYGLFLFDDRYASLDNHDDYIGLVRFDAAVPEPSSVLGMITAGLLGLLMMRSRSRRNA